VIDVIVQPNYESNLLGIKNIPFGSMPRPLPTNGKALSNAFQMRHFDFLQLAQQA
jgi:hypothetical protein